MGDIQKREYMIRKNEVNINQFKEKLNLSKKSN